MVNGITCVTGVTSKKNEAQQEVNPRCIGTSIDLRIRSYHERVLDYDYTLIQVDWNMERMRKECPLN